MRIETMLGSTLVIGMILGCGGEPETKMGPARAPQMIGKADGASDQADTSCLVVLRSVGRIPNQTGGYQTTCDAPGHDGTGDCLYVWEGHVDVDSSRVQQVQTVAVLFRTGTTFGQWYSADATPEEGADDGFAHFTFRIDRFTPSSGMSYSSLNQTVIELIPYLTTEAGRIFDHNTIANPLGSYRLDSSNGWWLSTGLDVCRESLSGLPEYVLSYPEFQEVLIGGPVVAGGKMKIRYDGRRLRATQPCMGGEGPVSSTTLSASWMFDGDPATIATARVEHYLESYGYACNGASPCIQDEVFEPVVDIPADARSISMWFYCVAMGHGDPSGYDSDYGDNYLLDIQENPAAPDWVGNFTVTISRDSSVSCGGANLEEGFTFGTWARQRASVANVCFEVWKEGTTDFDNPDLWKQLDVQLHTGFGDGTFVVQYVNFAGREGNNARYSFDLRSLDPFRPYHCPEVPTTVVYQGSEPYVRAGMQFFLTVNGVEIRPQGAGSFFQGSFEDYQSNPWREANCL